jgi:hypothetical protein
MAERGERGFEVRHLAQVLAGHVGADGTDLGGTLLEDGGEEVVLVAEVVVDSTGRDLRLRRDQVDARTLVSFTAEGRTSAADNRDPLLGPPSGGLCGLRGAGGGGTLPSPARGWDDNRP